MKQILVTGGCGYIGSHTVCSLIENSIKPIILDNNVNSYEWIIDNIKEFYNKDSCIFVKNNCEYIKNINYYIHGIIHFAAHKSVGESSKKALEYYHNNICSLLNILEFIDKYRVQNFIFSSSCTVYGDVGGVVNENNAIVDGSSVYGQTKIMCEKIINDFYHQNKDLNCVILRYFNPIGANIKIPIGEYCKKTPENLMSRLLNYISNKCDFVLHGDDYNTMDGSAIRDYVDVNDLSNAHVYCLKKYMNSGGVFKTFNVGSGKGISVKELIACLEKVIGKKIKYKVGQRRCGDIESIFADTSKIKNELDISCDTSLEKSLTDAWIWQQYLNKKGY
jgi:UDP-glucose 4-epimerase